MWTWGPCGPHILRYYILKIPSVSRMWSPGRGFRRGFLSILIKSSFFQNSWTCLQDCRGTDCSKKIASRWCYRLSIKKSDSTLQQSVLCQFSFLFCAGSLKMPLNMSEWDQNIIRLISNLYGVSSYKKLVGKFLRDSRNICTIKSFPIMNLKEGMTLNVSLYIGFC